MFIISPYLKNHLRVPFTVESKNLYYIAPFSGGISSQKIWSLKELGASLAQGICNFAINLKPKSLLTQNKVAQTNLINCF